MLINQFSMLNDIMILNNFFRIVETDNSSILYHTRCFDLFIFDCILTDFAFTVTANVDSDTFSFSFMSILEIIIDFLNLDAVFEFFGFTKLFSYSNLYLLDANFIFFFNLSIVNLYVDISNQIGDIALSLFQNSNLNIISKSISLFNELVFFFDFFLYFFEILTILFIFISFKDSFRSLLGLASSLYFNILNFFIKNGLSLVEFSFLFTFFIFFILFDLFVSFSEDDFFDVFFYIIIIFIALTFFFISIALDVQYFFMMNSVNNGYVNLRVLFFDIVNNFLCILRVFSCWVRYVFYDLQVEFLDLSFWYIDYSNDYLLFDNNSNLLKSNSNILVFFKIFLLDFMNFFFDLVFVLVQVWVSFVKIFLASYLLWLITDLFILRVFGFSESRSLNKFN